MTIGKKYDSGKTRWTLLHWEYLEGIAKVATFGAAKYDDHNWTHVEPRERYADAMLRHIYAFIRGEWKDPETNLPHLFHVGWNAMACWYKYKDVQAGIAPTAFPATLNDGGDKSRDVHPARHSKGAEQAPRSASVEELRWDSPDEEICLWTREGVSGSDWYKLRPVYSVGGKNR